MSVINDLINIESDSLDFGNYELATKTKKDGIEYKGDIYKIKTFNEITKLEKNGMFVYESVPGTAVHGFRSSEECNGHRNFFFRGRTGRCSDHTGVRRRD